MQRIMTAVALFLFVQTTMAQKGIKKLIQAEKKFAAYSRSHSTKEAFLAFMDSTSIMFDNGQPIKGIDFWNKREKNNAVLNWWPQYAEISSSNKFGYTTGPWTYRSSKNDSIVATGRYITVWHLNKNGEWKFSVDLGVSNTPPDASHHVTKINFPKGKEIRTEKSLLTLAESDFIEWCTKDKARAYKEYLSAESIVNRNGMAPFINQAQQQAMIDSLPSIIQYTMDGSDLSIMHDLGYTYGTTVIHGKTENYLRIWRREETGWKIAVEVLRY